MTFLSKTLLTSAITGLIYLTPDPKPNTYTLTEQQAINIINANVASKEALKTSQSPAIVVNQINQINDSTNQILLIQYQSFHPQKDSIKEK